MHVLPSLPPPHTTNKGLQLEPKAPIALQFTSNPIATIYQFQPMDMGAPGLTDNLWLQ
jgi:hypothetical protein